MGLAVQIFSVLLFTVESIQSTFLFILYYFVSLTSLLVVAEADVVPLPADLDSRQALPLHFSSTKRFYSRTLLL